MDPETFNSKVKAHANNMTVGEALNFVCENKEIIAALILLRAQDVPYQIRVDWYRLIEPLIFKPYIRNHE